MWWWKRRRRLAYDVEAGWLLLYTCNFRCPYCFFPPAMLGAGPSRASAPAATG